MPNLFRRAVGLVIFSFSVGLVVASPAAAEPAIGGQTPPAAVNGVDSMAQATYHRALIRSRQTQRCLTSSTSGAVSTAACNTANRYQQWRFDRTNVQRIWNVGTGRCLDSNSQGHVYSLSCNGTDYQLWRAHVTGVESNYRTNRCLDSNAQGSVYTLSCSGSAYQVWQKVFFSTP